MERVLDPMRMRLLIEIGRCGSISAAASACGIGQPSASTHLHTLEAVLDCRLVERDARGSRLTDEGVMVADYAARVLETIGELHAALAARPQLGRAA